MTKFTAELWKKRRPKTVFDYIFNKIDVQTNGCWFWKGAKSNKVGGFAYDNEIGPAPRKVYEKLVGLIPNGLCALHTCDDYRCVNPKHIYPGTKKQNRQDFMQRHPKAKELMAEATKRANAGLKRKWDSMSPEERTAFIKMRKEKEMAKHPPGSPSRIKAAESRRKTLEEKKNASTNN